MVMDILVRPVDRIAWNTTTWVEAIEQHMGGNGANTSYAAAVCGAAVRLVSVAGRDAFGDRLLSELAGAGVDGAHVRRTDGPTAATVALVNSAGDRLFLHRIGAGAEAFDPPESDSAICDGISRFHLANLFSLPGLRRRGSEILRGARAAGLATSVDTGWDSQGRWIEDLAPCLPWTDLLFVNQDEAQHLGAAPDIRDAALQAELKKWNAREGHDSWAAVAARAWGTDSGDFRALVSSHAGNAVAESCACVGDRREVKVRSRSSPTGGGDADTDSDYHGRTPPSAVPRRTGDHGLQLLAQSGSIFGAHWPGIGKLFKKVHDSPSGV